MPPIIRAAWTNSRVRRVSTSPLTSRAAASQDSSDITTMISHSDGVNMLTTISSSTRPGMARKVSTARIITASTTPPKYPAKAPYRVPMTVVASATAKPSSSEERPPAISRPSTS